MLPVFIKFENPLSLSSNSDFHAHAQQFIASLILPDQNVKFKFSLVLV